MAVVSRIWEGRRLVLARLAPDMCIVKRARTSRRPSHIRVVLSVLIAGCINNRLMAGDYRRLVRVMLEDEGKYPGYVGERVYKRREPRWRKEEEGRKDSDGKHHRQQ